MSRLGMLAALGAWVLAAPALAVDSAGFSKAEVGRVDRLLQFIQKRLELAPAVAEARWKTMSRIEDSGSAQAVIDAAGRRSARLGLDPALAARFAQAQIDAAKIIQTARHRQWAADAIKAPAREAETNPFRATMVEPEIGPDMLGALRDAIVVLRRHGGRNLLDARAADLIQVGGPDLLAGQAALGPLYEIAN